MEVCLRGRHLVRPHVTVFVPSDVRVVGPEFVRRVESEVSSTVVPRTVVEPNYKK